MITIEDDDFSSFFHLNKFKQPYNVDWEKHYPQPIIPHTPDELRLFKKYDEDLRTRVISTDHIQLLDFTEDIEAFLKENREKYKTDLQDLINYILENNKLIYPTTTKYSLKVNRIGGKGQFTEVSSIQSKSKSGIGKIFKKKLNPISLWVPNSKEAYCGFPTFPEDPIFFAATKNDNSPSDSPTKKFGYMIPEGEGIMMCRKIISGVRGLTGALQHHFLLNLVTYDFLFNEEETTDPDKELIKLINNVIHPVIELFYNTLKNQSIGQKQDGRHSWDQVWDEGKLKLYSDGIKRQVKGYECDDKYAGEYAPGGRYTEDSGVGKDPVTAHHRLNGRDVVTMNTVKRVVKDTEPYRFSTFSSDRIYFQVLFELLAMIEKFLIERIPRESLNLPPGDNFKIIGVYSPLKTKKTTPEILLFKKELLIDSRGHESQKRSIFYPPDEKCGFVQFKDRTAMQRGSATMIANLPILGATEVRGARLSTKGLQAHAQQRTTEDTQRAVNIRKEADDLNKDINTEKLTLIVQLIDESNKLQINQSLKSNLIRYLETMYVNANYSTLDEDNVSHDDDFFISKVFFNEYIYTQKGENGPLEVTGPTIDIMSPPTDNLDWSKIKVKARETEGGKKKKKIRTKRKSKRKSKKRKSRKKNK
jgi:hypothetical protein